MVLWCPDWPVIAAGIVEGVPAHGPVAVLHAGRVLACSPAARADGVRRGLRKREAQGRCPRLVVVDHDAGRDTRAFEPVLAAVEQLAAGVEVVRPGVCAVAARGPARYFGSEEAAAELLVEHVAQACDVEAQVGIADGVFAATLAARAGRLIPPDRTTSFLAGLDVGALGRPALVDLLRRLGIRTLGDFAALPAGDVLARFGFDAALAHQLAAGRDAHPLAPRQPPPDLDVTQEFDEPVDRVDAAAFAARALAEQLHQRLAGHGLACTRLGIEARTVHGEELYRTWRHDGLLSAAGIADRVRWQLDGWLTTAGKRSVATSALVSLRLVPEGVVEHAGLQLGLWGEAGEERDRAHRALTRVQGLIGPEAVVLAELGGGRSAGGRVRLVPWGDERSSGESDQPCSGGGSGEPPWPGRLPPPAPATILPEPLPACVTTADGTPVGVTGRLAVTGEPALVTVGDGRPVEVWGWAGPWPVDERWWAPDEADRRVRFQLLLSDGQAFLMSLSGGRWVLEAVYD
ncbi:DNA polymerase Y family protein [Planosporangium thailandense]|uniref:DNA polymerase Y family protein n=1 Tax=Planosporangium thailandense TaxID=765197 RepID=A0ABX0XVC2_9ACTN|nr:DNA polymerase Y family protein [Planosporangium thailandense]NJC69761.1 DNA polymerase Y family protein [Planosporangium thailandense]